MRKKQEHYWEKAKNRPTIGHFLFRNSRTVCQILGANFDFIIINVYIVCFFSLLLFSGKRIGKNKKADVHENNENWAHRCKREIENEPKTIVRIYSSIYWHFLSAQHFFFLHLVWHYIFGFVSIVFVSCLFYHKSVVFHSPDIGRFSLGNLLNGFVPSVCWVFFSYLVSIDQHLPFRCFPVCLLERNAFFSLSSFKSLD